MSDDKIGVIHQHLSKIDIPNTSIQFGKLRYPELLPRFTPHGRKVFALIDSHGSAKGVDDQIISNS